MNAFLEYHYKYKLNKTEETIKFMNYGFSVEKNQKMSFVICIGIFCS